MRRLLFLLALLPFSAQAITFTWTKLDKYTDGSDAGPEATGRLFGNCGYGDIEMISSFVQTGQIYVAPLETGVSCDYWMVYVVTSDESIDDGPSSAVVTRTDP